MTTRSEILSKYDAHLRSRSVSQTNFASEYQRLTNFASPSKAGNVEADHTRLMLHSVELPRATVRNLDYKYTPWGVYGAKEVRPSSVLMRRRYASQPPVRYAGRSVGQVLANNKPASHLWAL